ncbi:MAG: ATP-dependent Clp protease ATP-binding subunit [Anaerolineaceae bacterium]|nr:ATP-dependent Clp protease ATP-binding subunit [Anaerolineaceae bacterium]
MAGMSGALNPDLLASDFAATLKAAAQLQREFRQATLMPELILLALLRQGNSPADAVLSEFRSRRGLDLEQLERQVQLACANRRDPGGRLVHVLADGRRATLSRQSIILIDDALEEARRRDTSCVDCDHILLVLASDNISTSGLLRPHGITARTVADVMNRLNRPAADGQAAPDCAEGGSSPPTEEASVYERKDLLRSMLTIINQAVNRHLVLVGPAGVGKRSLALGLGQLIARGEGPRGINRVVQIAEDELLDDDPAALRRALAQARGGILFLPHLQRFLGRPGVAQFSRCSSLVLKTLLANDPVIIATTGDNDWNARLCLEPGVSENCQVLQVPQPSNRETLQILRALKPRLERDYQLRIRDEALNVAISLARRHLAATPLPRSAENLLHRSAAMVNTSRQTGPARRSERDDSPELDADDLRLCASQMTGVPVNQLGEDERRRYASLTDYLKQRLIGQDQAVQAVSRAIRTARVGLKEPQRPVGAFLFLGPTGVGKTELARTLADFMFGDEQAMLALDMSEFKDESSINRLLGSPSGYVDSDAGGQLTERVRRQPWLLVLLDEVEKAHPRIMDLLLQMIEEGRLTDGRGRSASFSETVLILTSNLGSRDLAIPVITDAAREAAMEQARTWFRPELLNRLDEIVMFNALSDDDLGAILKLMLAREQQLAAERGLQLEFGGGALQWLQQQYDEIQYGARPLLRIIRRHVRAPLADYLLSADAPANSRICIDADSSGLSFVTMDADSPLQD